jgi:adenylate kinase family enzyme
MVRYSNAGLERLGLTYSFSNYLRREYNGNEMITSWYDQVTDEILFSGKNTNAATFNERFKTFQGAREYISMNGITPERSMGIATKIYFILQGAIWVTDVNSITAQENFVFGDYKNPQVRIVTNESPSTVKRWNQIKVYGPKPISTDLSSGLPDNAIANTPLLSYIEDGWWIERKDDWEAAIRRAYNTPGNVMSGKLMECRILYSNFVFDSHKFSNLNFLEIKSNASIVQ